MPPTAPLLSPEALRARLGATMAGARRMVLELLKPHRLNEPFRSELLAQLMHHQPSARRVPASQIDAFVRMKRPPHNNVCLFAILDTGRTADVSWLRSVRNLYGRHNEEAEATRRVIAAFRNEVHVCSPKMREARAAFTVGPCADCGRRRKLAIDHAGAPFAQILDEFLIAARSEWAAFIDEASAAPRDRERGAAPPPFIPSACIGSIALRWQNGAHILADRTLARLWCDWHEARAELVGLCKPCNSSKGSGGYRYSFSQGMGGDDAPSSAPRRMGSSASSKKDEATGEEGSSRRARVGRRKAAGASQSPGGGGIMKAARKRKRPTTRPDNKDAPPPGRKRARRAA